MDNNFQEKIFKKLKKDYELEKMSPQFNQIEKLKKEIKEKEETIKNHKSDIYEKDVLINQKGNLEEKLKNIIESN